jgi:hypothetical protein
MFENQQQYFWLENVGNLFSSSSFVPKTNDSFEQQMNAISRFVILLFIFLLIFYSSKSALTITFFLLLIVICSYYCGKIFSPNIIKEPYGNVPSVQERVIPPPKLSSTNNMVITPTYNQTQQCRTQLPSYGEITLNRKDPNYQLVDGRVSSAWEYQNGSLEESVSNNQKLAGGPNPKTLVQPVIPSPCFDESVWQLNDFVVPTGINNQKRQELYSNGYVSTMDTVLEKRQPMRRQIVPSKPFPVVEGFSSRTPIENFKWEGNNIENPSLDKQSNNNYQFTDDDMMDFGCGYQPLNLESNLPSNYSASKCQTQDNMKDYNNKLFSTPLQPGLYTKTQVNQPNASMSNLGISFTQPHLPTTFETKKDYQTFVELDPYQMKPVKEEYSNPKDPFRRDIYDPRLTGYGTSYRTYLEPVTGQPRFYYRDIDQQTQNGYLTRNKIDFAQFGTTTGVYPFDEPLEGSALRDHANTTFTDSQIGYRTELQQRLMQKNSARQWQQRMAPIYRNQQTKGFMGTNSSKNYAGPRGG